MEFAQVAEKGLELATESSLDVVLSDWKMERMGGLEFLKIIRDQCPLAIRVIFSSFSDKHSILDCAGIVHQFLPKPVDREALISTIERATLTRSLLPTSEIRQRISQMEGIPSIPRLYEELAHYVRFMLQTSWFKPGDPDMAALLHRRLTTCTSPKPADRMLSTDGAAISKKRRQSSFHEPEQGVALRARRSGL